MRSAQQRSSVWTALGVGVLVLFTVSLDRALLRTDYAAVRRAQHFVFYFLFFVRFLFLSELFELCVFVWSFFSVSLLCSPHDATALNADANFA